MIERADNWLMDRTQEAYLWLLDRTGVYVGTLQFAAVIGDVLCHVGQRGTSSAVDFFVLAFMGIGSGLVYARQGSGSAEAYNVLVLAWRARRIRFWLNGAWLALIVLDAAHLRPWGLVSDFFIVAWGYLCTVLIRDREPPEKRFSQLAHETGGAR